MDHSYLSSGERSEIVKLCLDADDTVKDDALPQLPPPSPANSQCTAEAPPTPSAEQSPAWESKNEGMRITSASTNSGTTVGEIARTSPVVDMVSAHFAPHASTPTIQDSTYLDSQLLPGSGTNPLPDSDAVAPRALTLSLGSHRQSSESGQGSVATISPREHEAGPLRVFFPKDQDATEQTLRRDDSLGWPSQSRDAPPSARSAFSGIFEFDMFSPDTSRGEAGAGHGWLRGLLDCPQARINSPGELGHDAYGDAGGTGHQPWRHDRRLDEENISSPNPGQGRRGSRQVVSVVVQESFYSRLGHLFMICWIPSCVGRSCKVILWSIVLTPEFPLATDGERLRTNCYRTLLPHLRNVDPRRVVYPRTY